METLSQYLGGGGMNTSVYCSFYKFYQNACLYHPAGDVSGMWRIGDGDAEIKIEKKAKFPVRLVLSQVPFKSGVWNKAYKMPKYVLSLLVKPKLRIFCLFCATDCTVLEVKGKINV